MPYAIRREKDKWKVINEDTGDVKGTHDTEKDAKAQLAALYVHASPDMEKDEPTTDRNASVVGSSVPSTPEGKAPAKASTASELGSSVPSVPTETGTNSMPVSKSDETEHGYSMFMPITKVDIQNREVWGYGSIEEPDQANEIMDWATSREHFAKWSEMAEKRSGGKSKGNVRAMHQAIAAGKLIECTLDDANKGLWVGAKIVDDNEWKKVAEGVYTGFSIGGSYLRKWPDSRYPGVLRYTARPSELSIVDSPCVPGATFRMVKADGVVPTEFHPGAGMNRMFLNIGEVETPSTSSSSTTTSSDESSDTGNLSDLVSASDETSTSSDETSTSSSSSSSSSDSDSSSESSSESNSVGEDGLKCITLTVKCSPQVAERFLRFLSMCQRACHIGHSGRFAIPLDGDGDDRLSFEGVELPKINPDDIAEENGYEYLKPSAMKADKGGDLNKKIESPEPIATINTATPNKPAVEVDRMPTPFTTMEVEPGKEPSQDDLMGHAITKEEMATQLEQVMDYIPEIVKSAIRAYVPYYLQESLDGYFADKANDNQVSVKKATPTPVGRVIQVVRKK